MTLSEQFAADVDAFLASSGMTATAFGKEAIGDPSFVTDLKRGRSPGLGSVDRVYEFIRARTQEAAAQ
jgi:hypothetical protein